MFAFLGLFAVLAVTAAGPLWSSASLGPVAVVLGVVTAVLGAFVAGAGLVLMDSSGRRWDTTLGGLWLAPLGLIVAFGGVQLASVALAARTTNAPGPRHMEQARRAFDEAFVAGAIDAQERNEQLGKLDTLAGKHADQRIVTWQRTSLRLISSHHVWQGVAFLVLALVAVGALVGLNNACLGRPSSCGDGEAAVRTSVVLGVFVPAFVAAAVSSWLVAALAFGTRGQLKRGSGQDQQAVDAAVTAAYQEALEARRRGPGGPDDGTARPG